MESQPQNPEFRINPENFYPCMYMQHHAYHGISDFAGSAQIQHCIN